MKRWLAITVFSNLFLFACGNVEEESSGASDDQQPEEEQTVPENQEESNSDIDDESNGEDEIQEETELSINVADYFPIIEDTLYLYSSSQNDWIWYPQFTTEDQMQVMNRRDNMTTVTVYTYFDEQIEETFIRSDTHFRDNFIETELVSTEENLNIVLQAPIEEGHEWENPSGAISEIIEVGSEIETGAGEFETIHVARTEPDGEIVHSYFAEGVGLVFQVVETSSSIESEYTLNSIDEGVPEPDHTVPIFTYDYVELEPEEGEEATLFQHEIPVELYTNDPIRFTIMDLLSEERDDLVGWRSLLETGEINYMYMTDEGIPHVDFSEGTTRDMTGGSSSEHLNIYTLTYMVGAYYNVDEIIFTVEGETWSSSHIIYDSENVTLDFEPIIDAENYETEE